MKFGKKEKPGKAKKKILAVSSGGGHWVQLLRLRPAFEGHEVVYVTVNKIYNTDVKESKFYVIQDATRWNKLKLIKQFWQLFYIVLRENPSIVISTGAAPGFFAVLLGKFLRARTIWLDSIANVEKISLSGRLVKIFTDLWLTQWPELAGNKGPLYRGSII